MKSTYHDIIWHDPLEKCRGVSDKWPDEKLIETNRKMILRSDAILLHYEKVPTWGSPREQEFVSMINKVGEFVRNVEELTDIKGVQIAKAASEVGLPVDIDLLSEKPVYVQTTEGDPSPWLTVDAEVISQDLDVCVEAIREDCGGDS